MFRTRMAFFLSLWDMATKLKATSIADLIQKTSRQGDDA
jgi:hypothetical protein